MKQDKNNVPYRLLEKICVDTVNEFSNKSLNKGTCNEIYCKLFENITELVKSISEKNSTFTLTNEAMNYVAQRMYLSIDINGSHGLDPTIFTQLSKFENMPTHDLINLCVLLRGSPHVTPIILEIKRR